MRGSTEIVKLPGGVYDFHCHLRAGALMKTVARLHYESGVRVALAMV